MSFASELAAFRIKVTRAVPAVYVGVATRAHRSIKGVGSPDPVTGAPGQPVDSGFLKNSWTLDIGKDVATIQTNVAYARVIEDNNRAAYDNRGAVGKYGVTGGLVGPALPTGLGRRSRKSTSGGNHSVKMTIAGASAIQRQVVAELNLG